MVGYSEDGTSVVGEAQGRAPAVGEDVVGKIKLSDTLQALTGRFNRIRGSELNFSLDVDDQEVAAGAVLRAQALLSSPEGKKRTLSCVRIELEGQIQSDGKWEDYSQRATTAEDIPLPGGSQYVIPIVVKLPAHAVLSGDGAHWRLRAQAVVDRTIDPRAEIKICVVSG